MGCQGPEGQLGYMKDVWLSIHVFSYLNVFGNMSLVVRSFVFLSFSLSLLFVRVCVIVERSIERESCYLVTLLPCCVHCFYSAMVLVVLMFRYYTT